jgi:hypothetical protein
MGGDKEIETVIIKLEVAREQNDVMCWRARNVLCEA